MLLKFLIKMSIITDFQICFYCIRSFAPFCKFFSIVFTGFARPFLQIQTPIPIPLHRNISNYEIHATLLIPSYVSLFLEARLLYFLTDPHEPCSFLFITQNRTFCMSYMIRNNYLGAEVGVGGGGGTSSNLFSYP